MRMSRYWPSKYAHEILIELNEQFIRSKFTRQNFHICIEVQSKENTHSGLLISYVALYMEKVFLC